MLAKFQWKGRNFLQETWSSLKGGEEQLTQIKLVCLGADSCGKSSLLSRFVKGEFNKFQVCVNSDISYIL